MNKVKYEGTIEGYSFLMKDDDVIEVWSDFDADYPETYIYLREGSIQNEKQFHMEIASWWIHNKS